MGRPTHSTASAPAAVNALAPDPARAAPRSAAVPSERELVALWLLGRVPAEVLAPWALARAGRAGRGPGPDVREAAVVTPDGVLLAGDVEVHVHASDYARHGHVTDAAYTNVIAQLVWVDDVAPGPLVGPAWPLRTVAVAGALRGDVERLRALVRAGPSGGEACADERSVAGAAAMQARVRREGQRRLAEHAWRAAELAALGGWEHAWETLLERALVASAGRRTERPAERAALAQAVTRSLCAAAGIGGAHGGDTLRALSDAVRTARAPAALIAVLRGDGALGVGRAAEVGWNAVLPLAAAAAAAFGDVTLAAANARLAARWPAPRPYGRTRALAQSLAVTGTGHEVVRVMGLDVTRNNRALSSREPAAAPGSLASLAVTGAGRERATGVDVPRNGGALYAQGLLRLQELWCSRGGCGVCPLSPQWAAVSGGDGAR